MMEKQLTISAIVLLAVVSQGVKAKDGFVGFEKPVTFGKYRAHNLAAYQIVPIENEKLLIKSFIYDGTAPSAFFCLGNGPQPTYEQCSNPKNWMHIDGRPVPGKLVQNETFDGKKDIVLAWDTPGQKLEVNRYSYFLRELAYSCSSLASPSSTG